MNAYIFTLRSTASMYQGFPDPQWPTPSQGSGDHDNQDHGDGTGPSTGNRDETLALLLPLLILLTTLLLLLLIFLVFLILLRRSRRGAIALSDHSGPINLEREDDIAVQGGLAGVEQRWLETVEDSVRIGHLRSKDWQAQYPPNSQPTDITLSQFLSIQEKGVSAWAFEPDYESNPALIVQSRTEVIFLSDGVGMAPEEGGGCCVQSNLPIPKLNDVYYWECKLFEKPESTTVAIGLATKPYPSFRLPGWNRYSVGYFSSDGFKCHSHPFASTSYGPPLTEGDVLGIGYRPRTGTVFFTRNGRKLEDAYIGLNRHNLFPTVGANAACTVHVNFGQAGFVFIEANVKKWGLAPMMGTLAPPPAYGSERGSILLQAAGTQHASSSASSSRSEPLRHGTERSSRRTDDAFLGSPAPVPTSAVGAASALGFPTPNQPIRPSPLRHSRQLSNLSSRSSDRSSGTANGSANLTNEDSQLLNPPTPGLLDISLHSMHRFPVSEQTNGNEDGSDQSQRSESAAESRDASESENESGSEAESHGAQLEAHSGQQHSRDVSPPAYHPIDPHMYAPGVAEAVLEDAFRHTPGGPYMAGLSSSSSPTAYEASHSGLQASHGSLLGWFTRRSGHSHSSNSTNETQNPDQRP